MIARHPGRKTVINDDGVGWPDDADHSLALRFDPIAIIDVKLQLYSSNNT